MTKAERVARWIDRLNERVGRVVSWLTLTMALITFTVATLRYGFDMGWVWFQEIYVWMHGAIIMVAMGYTLVHDGHVRVDIFYRTASRRYRAAVDLIGTLLLLFPTLGVVAWYTVPYVLLSWHRLEASREANGMPALYLLKTTMLLFFLLLFLQGLALVLRSLETLASGRSAPPGHGEEAGA